MKLSKNLFSARPLHPIQMGWFILMELLLLFGEIFSKFHVFGPFHLFDLSFVLLAVWSLYFYFKQPRAFLLWPLLLVLVFSVAYLAWSWVAALGPTNYMIRQYALFVYMGGSWLLFASYVKEEYAPFNIRFIALMGVAALAIQLVYLLYLALFTDDFSLFGNFNYYNKMTVIALLAGGAYLLVYVPRLWQKILVASAFLLLSTTLGHASAFMAAFMIVASYILLHFNRTLKIISLVALVLIIAGFIVYLPQFSDHNAEWRVVFWRTSLKEIILQKYALLGHGFGVPYSSQEVLDAFREQLNSPWFEVRPEEQYLSPMHNSFITMAFHIGLLPSLLILVPVWPALVYLFGSSRVTRTSVRDFLVLSLIGVSVWSSFNVVLELPHSATFYWLVYFTLVYEFRYRSKAK